MESAALAFRPLPQGKKIQHTGSLVPRKCSLFSFSSPICCRRESFSPSHCSVKVSFLISATAPAITSAGVDVKIPLKVADAAALSTVNGEVVATEEAGTYVLKPFRSPKSKKLKTAVVFVPRLSHFDIENEQSNKNEFRVRPHHFLYTCHRFRTHRDNPNRGFSRSFGFRSSCGRSARTCEASKHRAHRSICDLQRCSRETPARWRSVMPYLS